MASNPLIALQAKTPDFGQTFNNALLNVQRMDQIRDARDKRPTEQAKFNERQGEIIKSLGVAGQQIIPDLQRGNIEGVLNTLVLRRSQLKEQGLPTDETDDAIALAQDNPGELLTRSQQAVELAKGLDTQTTGLASAKTEILESGSVIQALPDGTVQVRNPSGKVVEGQDRLDVLKQSRQQAIETLQTESDIKAAQAGKAEEAKSKVQLKYGPQIEKDVVAARKLATEQGDVFNELNQAKASLPGLTQAVGELKELATIATSTLGGKIFDSAVKETGFGATKGATARAKFIAIVNNQVLPLLKQTFGGSFSVQEGQELKASMGDPDATPAEKMAQLDAFIAQKIRNIETKEAQLQPGAAPAGGQVDLSTMSTEELIKMRQEAQ